jgi:anthranilate phosphoribosyltransferase
MVGVFSKQWIEPVAQVLRNLGSERAWVVHGSDGLDEITLAGPTTVASLQGGAITVFEIRPEDVGLRMCRPEELRGGEAEANATALRAVLQRQDGADRDVALLNAAASLVVAGRVAELAEGLVLARQSVDSGRAEAALERLIAISNL